MRLLKHPQILAIIVMLNIIINPKGQPRTQAHSKNWRKGPGIHCLCMHLIPDIPGIPDNTIIPLCAVTFTCTLPYIYPFTADNGYLYARFCCVVCRLRQPDIIIASVRIALVRIALAFLSSVQQGRALECDFVALNRLITHCHTNWKDTGKPPKCGCL